GEGDAVAGCDLSTRMGDGEAGGDAAAGGAAVDLGLAEPAEVMRQSAWRQAIAVSQDGAVEERELRFLGVAETPRRAQFSDQFSRGFDQLDEGRLMEVEAEPVAWQDGVEGAAIADIELDPPKALQIDAVIKRESKGFDAVEPHNGRC